MIDCCFLTTENSKKSYQSLSNTYSAIEPPTWSLLLAESARSKGFKVNILDANAEKLDPASILLRLKEINPRILCLVVYGQNVNAGTANMSGAIFISDYLKKNTRLASDMIINQSGFESGMYCTIV